MSDEDTKKTKPETILRFEHPKPTSSLEPTISQQVESLREEVKLIRSTVLRINDGRRHLVVLQALKAMYPKLTPKRLMELAKSNIELSERHANLQSRTGGVTIFSFFSIAFSSPLVASFWGWGTSDAGAIALLSGFTSFCLCLVAFFLGAPRAAITYFAEKMSVQSAKGSDDADSTD